MRKILLALTFIVLVTIPFALGANAEVGLDSTKFKASPNSITAVTGHGFATAKLDLTDEKIVGNTTEIGGWSTDGTKWKVGAPEPKDIQKFLNKAGQLWIIDKLDGKKKPDPEGYVIVAFEKTGDRLSSKNDKAKPYYMADNKWVLTKNGATGTSFNTYDFVLLPEGEKKLADDAEWKLVGGTGWKAEWDVACSLGDDGGKNAKETYFFRMPATASSTVKAAASKPFKVSPAQLAKPPKFKVDYKKEVIKLKAGVMYATGTSTAGTYAKFSGTAPLPAGEIVDYCTATTGGKLFLYTEAAATGKKPGSMVQELAIMPRAAAVAAESDGGLSGNKLKIAGDVKKYEFKATDTSANWSKSLPVTKDMTFVARLVATAKGKPGEEGVNAAGAISYGVIQVGNDDKGKPEIKEIKFFSKADAATKYNNLVAVAEAVKRMTPANLKPAAAQCNDTVAKLWTVSSASAAIKAKAEHADQVGTAEVKDWPADGALTLTGGRTATSSSITPNSSMTVTFKVSKGTGVTGASATVTVTVPLEYKLTA